MKEVFIAGGGLIGLLSAYFLDKEGHKVTIADKNDFLKNCSLGNAGLIVPSHYMPLAAPGIIPQAIKWMLNSKSPLSIHLKPDLQFLNWCMKFWRASNRKHVSLAGPLLLELNQLSKKLYKQIHTNEFQAINFRETGLLMLCKTSKTFGHEIKIASDANKIGIQARIINKYELQDFAPEMEFDVEGGVYYPDDAIVSPDKLTTLLINYLQQRNVKMISDSEVLNFTIRNEKIESVVIADTTYKFDEFIIAAGFESQKIFNKLKLIARIQPGKGYSFTLPISLPVKCPLILIDARVAVSTYEQMTRFGGMMEIGGNSDKINRKRLEGMVESIKNFIPGVKVNLPEENEIWSGMRPCSVDGMPYLGRTQKYKNVIVATGHSMMGLSTAPATGKLIEEIVSGKTLSMNIDAFSPDR